MAIKEPKWHLDLFSTILSRKQSLHKRQGKQLLVKIKKEEKTNGSKYSQCFPK